MFLDEIGKHKEDNAGGRRNDGLLSSPVDKEPKTDGPEEHAPEHRRYGVLGAEREALGTHG